MAGLLTFLVLFYTVFMAAAIFSWLKFPSVNLPENYQPQTRLSVLIAVRNEEAGLLKLLQDLANQTYPKAFFEVIIIDDFSEDRTVELVTDFQQKTTLDLKLLRL